jgi:3-oxoacyl-[acyl-carrier protein] reductase
MKLLINKVCLLTGASGEIGLGCAKKFHENGSKLILIYNKNKKIIDKFKKNKIDVDVFKCDITNIKEIKNLYKKISKKYTELNVLINIAGIMNTANFFSEDKGKSLIKHIKVNLIGNISMIKTFSRMMIRSENASIVNISSIAANCGIRSLSDYSATKGAIQSYSLSAAAELGPLGVRVNTISPGIIRSKIHKDNNVDKFKNQISLNRIGEPEDVANVALFLASELSSYVNGQNLLVDGMVKKFKDK